ncbi:hypothetical protein TB1_007405 [Malus domestica]
MCLCSIPSSCSGVSTNFLVSSWTKPDQVIGLSGQDEPSRGSSMRTFTRKLHMNREEPISPVLEENLEGRNARGR